MTTSAKTVTRTKFVRSWLDFDPKFLAALAVLIGTAVLSGVLAATGTITVVEAGSSIGPVFLAAAAAYVATSSHREVLEDAIGHAGQVLQDSTPVLEVVAPQAVPAAKEAVDAVSQLQAALAEDPPVFRA